MKKKVALLLALVMVLSLLPMNVFGAAGVVRQTSRSTAPQNITVDIRAIDLDGRIFPAGGLFLVFDLSGGRAAYEVFASPSAISFTGGTAFDNATLGTPFLQDGGRRLVAEIIPGPGETYVRVPAALTVQTIQINNVELDRAGVRLTAFLAAGSPAGLSAPLITLADGYLIPPAIVPGVTIGVGGGAVPIATHARLNNITIQERGVGNLATIAGDDSPVPFAVRLTAPRGFRWETSRIVGIGGGDLTVTSANTQVMPNPAYDVVFMEMSETAQRHELVIEITPGNRVNSALARMTLAQFNIENLILVATSYAPAAGDVLVDVEVGVWAQSVVVERADTDALWATATTRANTSLGYGFVRNAVGLPGAASGNAIEMRVWTPSEDRSNDDHWRSRTLHVATRGAVGAVAVYGPDEINEFTSGGFTGEWMNNGYFTIRLQETVAGAILTAIDTYEIRLPEGASFANAEFRIGDTGNATRVTGWTSVADNDTHVLSGLSYLDGRVLSIGPRPQYPEAQARRRHIDFRFELSIEAGFESRHGDEIEARVYRNGSFIGRTVIATVVDPIRVTAGPAVVLERLQLDMIPLTQLPNITLTELEPGALEQGQEIWIYLEPTQNGVPVPVPAAMNVSIPHFIVNNAAESGLILRQIGAGGQSVGSPAPEGYTAAQLALLPDFSRPAFVFRVERASHDVPASVTFSASATGWLVPGIEYKLVIGGPAVAPNSHMVVPPTTANLATSFFSLPYSVTVLAVTGEAHVEGGLDTSIVTPVGALVMSTATPTMATNVRDAFGNRVAVNVAAPFVQGETAMMIAMRAFAHHIDAALVWDASTSTATIAGRHFVTGQPMSVAVQLNNPIAQITVGGTTFGQDIASFGGHFLSGPAGTVMPILIENLNYLPARFMAEVFGLVVDWNAATMTATIRMP